MLNAFVEMLFKHKFSVEYFCPIADKFLMSDTCTIWLGINFRGHKYHWYKINVFSDKFFIMFDHTYNQANGKTNKGIRHSMKVRDQIKRLTSLDINKLDS